MGEPCPSFPIPDLTITFNSDGTLTGFGGCNNFFGVYTLTGQTSEFGKGITMGPVGSTKMFCADTSSLETTYLANVQNARYILYHEQQDVDQDFNVESAFIH